MYIFMKGCDKNLWLLPLIAILVCASFGSSACTGKRDTGASIPAPKPESSIATPSDGRETELLFDTALNEFQAQNYEKARDGFKEVVSKDPGNYEAFLYIGKSSVALKNPGEVESALTEAIRLKPDYAEAHFELGKHYFDAEQYEKALPFLKDANKYNNKWPDAMVLLGDCYRNLKQYNYAAVPYGKAMGFEPDRADSYYGLGLTYIGLGNKIAARQQHRKLEQLDPNLAKQLQEFIDEM